MSFFCNACNDYRPDSEKVVFHRYRSLCRKHYYRYLDFEVKKRIAVKLNGYRAVPTDCEPGTEVVR